MGCVAVFAKPPVAGTSKTRLGRVVGHDRAAELARALLADSVDRWRATEHSVVLATTEPGADHGLHGAIPAVDQGGGDLGARIERVLRQCLAAHPWAMAVGADAPAVPDDAVDATFAALDAARTVLGPSDDGGFWVLGLSRCDSGLLDGLPWSAPTTYARTWERLVAQGHDPLAVPGAWDVDRADDLPRLAAADRLAPRSAALARAWLEGP